MDFIDYQKKLGLGFDDNRKALRFYTQIYNYFDECSSASFDRYEERAFCDMIGEYVKEDPDNFSLQKSVYGLQRAWMYLERHQRYFTDFLSCCIALINSLTINKDIQVAVKSKVLSSLDNCHILYDFITDDDGIFIFPRGAKELDDALVSEPLEWLKDYPQAHKTFCIALRQYSEGIYIRDVADNLRKALEAFLQEFLENGKNLETNKKEICRYFGKQGVDAGIAGLFQPLINSYKNINDRIAKHNDAVDKRLLEFLLYQTGILIRMVVTVKKQEKSK